MKFDPNKYAVLNESEVVEGRIDVRATQLCSIFVTSPDGVRSLLHTGYECQCTVSGLAQIDIQWTGAEGEAFFEKPLYEIPERRKEIFTSADLAPRPGDHSQIVAEVQRQLRLTAHAEMIKSENRRQKLREQDEAAAADLRKAIDEGDPEAAEVLAAQEAAAAAREAAAEAELKEKETTQ